MAHDQVARRSALEVPIDQTPNGEMMDDRMPVHHVEQRPERTPDRNDRGPGREPPRAAQWDDLEQGETASHPIGMLTESSSVSFDASQTIAVSER